jgi:hypothetical protein
VDFFVCCDPDSQRFWVLPFEAATVITLKIYNGKESKFHRYEDAWVLLEK